MSISNIHTRSTIAVREVLFDLGQIFIDSQNALTSIDEKFNFSL